MKRIIKKCIYIWFAFVMLTSCDGNSSPAKLYTIGEPIENDDIYIGVTSVVQKKTLLVKDKEYVAQAGKTYLVFYIDMKYAKKEGFDFSKVTYAQKGIDSYELKESFSKEQNRLTQEEWNKFIVTEKREIQLIFEGPEVPVGESNYGLILEQPFVIDREDIIVE